MELCILFYICQFFGIFYVKKYYDTMLKSSTLERTVSDWNLTNDKLISLVFYKSRRQFLFLISRSLEIYLKRSFVFE